MQTNEFRGQGSRRQALSAALAVCFSFVASAVAQNAAPTASPRVVVLTQTPCQFLESEAGKNHAYKSAAAKDCEAINARTGAARLAAAPVLQLPPGKTIFRVSNQGVPYELGFWLRAAHLIDRVSLPSVSGGGLTAGKTQDYAIDLRPGEYEYSCPLNPTPNYRLVVK